MLLVLVLVKREETLNSIQVQMNRAGIVQQYTDPNEQRGDVQQYTDPNEQRGDEQQYTNPNEQRGDVQTVY